MKFSFMILVLSLILMSGCNSEDGAPGAANDPVGGIEESEEVFSMEITLGSKILALMALQQIMMNIKNIGTIKLP